MAKSKVSEAELRPAPVHRTLGHAVSPPRTGRGLTERRCRGQQGRPRLIASGLRMAVLIPLLGLLGTGCDSTNEERTQAAEIESATGVTIDPRSGRIALPLSWYGPTRSERTTIEYAHELVVEHCMAAQGFRYLVFDRRSEAEDPSRLYGVWTTEAAARYGYGNPPKSSAERRLDRQNRRGFPPGGQRVFEGCLRRAGHLQIQDPLPGDVAAFELYSPAMQSKPAREAIRDWHRCLVAQGIPLPSKRSPWSPLGSRVRDTQGVALKDVRCKERANLVERLSEVEARFERRWIEEHRSILNRQRAQIERQLAAAKTVIARIQGREK
jgi:hypothetical protein